MLSLGIDLGTACARVAFCRDGDPELLQLPDGGYSVPSVVSISEGTTRVGRSALARAATKPEHTVRAIKRLLGRTANDPAVERLRELTPIGFEEGANGALLLRLGSEAHAPEDLAAAIIRNLVELVTEKVGEAPASAVLTTPYWYGPTQRAALGIAAQRAGLGSQQVLSEATCTALSLLDADRGSRLVAIVDVGAGGCTASVLEISERSVRLVASAADPLAGGEDVDWALVRAMLKGLRSRYGDFPMTPAVREMLRQTCERAKQELSQMSNVSVLIPYLPVGGGVYNQQIVVDRNSADALMQETVQRVGKACRAMLTGASIAARDLRAVYATGGTTRLPAIRAAIEGALGAISSRRLDPDGSVALGAATQAAMLDGTVASIPVLDIQTAMTIPPPSAGPVASIAPARIVTAPPPAPDRSPQKETIDVGEYRMELAGLLASLRAGALSDGGGKKARGVVAKVNEVIEDASEVSDEVLGRNAESLRALWHDLGLVMQTARQYRWEHPQTDRALEQAIERIASIHAQAPHAVRWDVGSLHFSHGGHIVWKPDRAPYDRVPYELFAAGLRKVQFHVGIGPDELREFLGVLVRDAALGFGADDDAATALWDRRLEHIAYLAVDAFADGDDPTFLDQRDEVAKQLTHLASLSDEGETVLGTYATAQRELAEAATERALDPATRERLAQDLVVEPERWLARYCCAFLDSLPEAETHGDLPELLAALDGWCEEQIGARAPQAALRLLSALLEAIEARPPDEANDALAAIVLDTMFPSPRLAALCEDLANIDEVPATVSLGLERALQLLPTDELVPIVLESYGQVKDAAVQNAFVGYLLRCLPGHEEQVGGLLARARPEHALGLVVELRVAGTDQARAAVAYALDSPHAEVRMEALAALPETPPDQVRDSVRRIIEDPEPELRITALETISRERIQAAGPILVHRIQGEAFDTLPDEERRLLLDAVGVLNRRRADELAIELLDRGGVFRSEQVDRSRAVAADFLAGSESPEALAALRKLSRRWFGSSEVREVAVRAAESVEQRRSLRPRPRKEGEK